MKILITGGGGFLGRFVARRLQQDGHDITVLGRNDYPFLIKEGFKTIKQDICDQKGLISVLKGYDEVHHIASLATVTVQPKPFFQINIEGTKNIIKACLFNGIKKLIYTSTPSVVYDSKSILMGDETLPYTKKQLSYYAFTKAIAENLVLKSNGQEIATTALRPHLIWGPEDTNLIPRIMNRAQLDRLYIIGDGSNTIDTTYVENAALAHKLASEKLAIGSAIAGKAYFITDDNPVNCWEFINQILESLSLPKVSKSIAFKKAYFLGFVLEKLYGLLKITKEPMMSRFLAEQLSMSHTFSIERAKKDLGYKPEISVDEGLKRLINYFNA